jgi:hypothetical protein
MQRYLLIIVASLGVVGCAPGYTRAELVYAQPAEYVYVVPMDRVVVVTQEVLVNRGWAVFRVERAGPNRIIWARRGEDEVVRIFASPDRERVVVRGLWEARAGRRHGDNGERREEEHDDRGRHRGWESRGQPHDIITEIDVRLRARG